MDIRQLIPDTGRNRVEMEGSAQLDASNAPIPSEEWAKGTASPPTQS